MNSYTKPLRYWMAAVAGLVLALLGDGVCDVVGPALVALPLVPVLRASLTLLR